MPDVRGPDCYEDTIRVAIAVGGDVDTTAAMAGAISGARVGLAGVPRALAEQLNDQERWGFDALRSRRRRRGRGRLLTAAPGGHRSSGRRRG